MQSKFRTKVNPADQRLKNLKVLLDGINSICILAVQDLQLPWTSVVRCSNFLLLLFPFLLLFFGEMPSGLLMSIFLFLLSSSVYNTKIVLFKLIHVAKCLF